MFEDHSGSSDPDIKFYVCTSSDFYSPKTLAFLRFYCLGQSDGFCCTSIHLLLHLNSEVFHFQMSYMSVSVLVIPLPVLFVISCGFSVWFLRQGKNTGRQRGIRVDAKGCGYSSEFGEEMLCGSSVSRKE